MSYLLCKNAYHRQNCCNYNPHSYRFQQPYYNYAGFQIPDLLFIAYVCL